MQRYRDEEIKIKRYGQVFSGKLVGDLLVSMLPQNLLVKTMIDPMVGQGDLLESACKKYSQTEVALGIDIDHDVIEKCKSNVPKAMIVIEDVFKSEKINIDGGWDLVITNPPYIRYQTLKNNPEIGLPDGKEIRKGLINHIQSSKVLHDQDKRFFLDIAQNYSGLSDMAVPSWILCASLVKKGGYMAMVVPETWLNRDYALPIHYMLLRCFDVISIASDVESSWFENAEVRTCLVICRRKDSQAISNCYSNTVLLDLSAGLMTSDSLVGNFKYDNSIGYDALERIISEGVPYSSAGFSARVVSALELFPSLVKWINEQKWVYKEDRLEIKNDSCLPGEIISIVGKSQDVEYDSVEDMGWSVSQGLRTGANDFFYANLISEDTKTVVRTEPWYGRNVVLSSDNVRRALKNRSDVDGLVVNYNDLNKCIFYIQHQVRRRDYQRLSQNVIDNYTLMNPDLDEYITQGEEYISPTHKKAFKDLSAVIPNEKKVGNEFERFWYMLPPLKERHVPYLCISRVCGGSPETLFVNQKTEKDIVVDANFITLWNSDCHTQVMMFALFNSTWAKLYLELVGTTMGGGALKIEASHVRKIVFPRLNNEKKKELENIGRKIIKNKYITENVQREIDEIVFSPFEEGNGETVYMLLKELLIRKIQERSGKKQYE